MINQIVLISHITLSHRDFLVFFRRFRDRVEDLCVVFYIILCSHISINIKIPRTSQNIFFTNKQKELKTTEEQNQ